MSTGKRRLLAYIMMILSGLVSVKLIKDIIRLSRVDDRLMEAEIELEMGEKEQKELKDKLEASGTNEKKKKSVRDSLKMARSNEVVVVIPEEIGGNGREEKGEEIEEDNLSNVGKWLKLFVY